MNEGINKGHCIEWMNDINGINIKENVNKLPQWSEMSSSIGINPCKNNYGNNILKVNDFKMLGGGYGLHPITKEGGTMIHVQTFNGKLNAVISYTYPTIDHDEAQTYSNIFQSILTKMCHKSNDNLTVSHFLQNK